MTRSAMLEVLGEDYIRTARAKGLSKLRVVALHAFRNALIPVVTVIGLQVGVLFTGAILTETIFSWPGVGKWLIEAINRRDYPVLQGGLLLLGVVVMIVNLLVDVTYGIINPRIRRSTLLMTTADASPPRPCGAAAPPGPLREFWGYFRANHGAVGGLVVVVVVLLMAVVRQRARALPARPHQQRGLPEAARVAGGRLVGLPARHRRDRPRHPVAPDLRRAAVAADRHRGRRAVDRRRHRARPRRRILRAASPRSRSCG